MLCYETEREEDSRYRNNIHGFNCESGNDSFVAVAVFMFFLFSSYEPAHMSQHMAV